MTLLKALIVFALIAIVISFAPWWDAIDRGEPIPTLVTLGIVIGIAITMLLLRRRKV